MVGLISDTHGRLHPDAARALAGVDLIVHAGDVCSVQVLHELEAIAPVRAVAGNCDRREVVGDLDAVVCVAVSGVLIIVVHDMTDLGEIPDGADVVVCGHTHRPSESRHGRALVVNPGSASQRRSMPHRSVGLLHIDAGAVSFELVELVEQEAARAAEQDAE